eukprot:m.300836 g.300836  ORF g.300836 m.300836 type:complete len:1254 (+) comp14547_c0_seq1:115-3876(+)
MHRRHDRGRALLVALVALLVGTMNHAESRTVIERFPVGPYLLDMFPLSASWFTAVGANALELLRKPSGAEWTRLAVIDDDEMLAAVETFLQCTSEPVWIGARETSAGVYHWVSELNEPLAALNMSRFDLGPGESGGLSGMNCVAVHAVDRKLQVRAWDCARPFSYLVQFYVPSQAHLGARLFQGHWYRAVPNEQNPYVQVSLRAFEQTLSGIPGRLVTIESKAEFDFLNATFIGDREDARYLIGGTLQYQSIGSWTWRWEYGPLAGQDFAFSDRTTVFSMLPPTPPAQFIDRCLTILSTQWKPSRCAGTRFDAYILEFEPPIWKDEMRFRSSIYRKLPTTYVFSEAIPRSALETYDPADGGPPIEGNIVVVESEEEDAFLRKFTCENTWLGLEYIGKGNWHWVHPALMDNLFRPDGRESPYYFNDLSDLFREPWVVGRTCLTTRPLLWGISDCTGPAVTVAEFQLDYEPVSNTYLSVLPALAIGGLYQRALDSRYGTRVGRLARVDTPEKTRVARRVIGSARHSGAAIGLVYDRHTDDWRWNNLTNPTSPVWLSHAGTTRSQAADSDTYTIWGANEPTLPKSSTEVSSIPCAVLLSDGTWTVGECVSTETFFPGLVAFSHDPVSTTAYRFESCELFCTCVDRAVYCFFLQIVRLPTFPPTTRHINVGGNHITRIYAGDLQGLSRLEELYFESSQLVQIDTGAFADLTSIRDLSLSANRLTTLTISSLPVRNIYVANNQLQSLSLLGLPRLQTVVASVNQITSLSISADSTELTTLKIDSNKLPRLPPSMPVSALQYLNVSFNEITFVDIFSSPIPKFFSFLADANKIETMVVQTGNLYPGLTEFSMDGNNCSCSLTSAQLFCLPLSCNIVEASVASSSSSAPSWLIPLVVCLVLVAAALVTAVALWRRRNLRRSAASKLHQINALAELRQRVLLQLMDAYGLERSRSELFLNSLQPLDVPRQRISMQHVIGRGQFGTVQYGTMAVAGDFATRSVPVAVKVLNDSANGTSQLLIALLAEAHMLNMLRHKHIVSLLAVCLESQPFLLITEYMERGSLKDFLRECRLADHARSELSTSDLVTMALHAASALQYLHSQDVLHRDIAARNCLVSLEPTLTVKLADLGLARQLTTSNYYTSATVNTAVPFRWMAPEALQDERFDERNDIWAFGVLLWEIFSFARTPYGPMSAREISSFLQQGQRLERPPKCPANLFELMLRCWVNTPAARPSMVEVTKSLTLISNMMVLDADDEEEVAL